jgi:cytochrome c oxidase subunit 3
MFTGRVQVQFQDLEQQTHAAELGIWAFMASEVLFFSGLFGLFAAYRFQYGDLFREAARHTDLALGTANTFILLTSSLLVAGAVHVVRQGSRTKAAARMLLVSIALGAVFLALKILEYAHHLRDGLAPGPWYHNADLPGRAPRVFFNLYYGMTGLHAIHVFVGMLLLAWIAWRLHRRDFDAEYHTPLELVGIYWHFVDVVWVFLWPMFYLMRT